MLRQALLVSALVCGLVATSCKQEISESEAGGGGDAGSAGTGGGGAAGEGGIGGDAGTGGSPAELPDPLGAWIQSRGPTGFTAERMLVLRSGTILALSFESMLRSTDGGTSWFLSEGIVGNGDRRLVEEAGGQLFLEDRGLGLWRSADDGGSWERIADWRGRSSFVADGNGTIFAVEPVGSTWMLVESADGGANWSEVASLPLGHGPSGRALFSAADKLFLLDPYGSSPLSRSDDGGLQWTAVDAGAIGPVVEFGDSLFVASGKSIGRSTDAGITWSVETLPADDLDSWTLELVPSGEALFRRTFGGGVLRWDAEAEAWNPAADGGPAGPGIGCGATGTTLFCGDREVLHRLDGEVWSAVATSYVGSAIEDLSGGEGRLFARTVNGRVSTSTDAGATWEPVPVDGSHFTPVDSGSWVAAGPAGTVLRSGDGVNWEPAIDFLDDWDRVEAFFPRGSSVILALASGKLIRSIDNGFRWKDFRRGLPVVGTDWEGYSVYPSLYGMADLGDVLLARAIGYGTLRSTDGGESWGFVTEGLPEDGELDHFVRTDGAIVAIDSTIDGPALYRSLDGGLSWEAVETNLPAGMLTYELITRGDELVALLRPMDASSSETPGAWISSDGGTSWALLGDPLPALTLDLFVEGSHLHAGTIGAGVWRLRLE